MQRVLMLFKRAWYTVLGKSEGLMDQMETADVKLRLFVDELHKEVQKQQAAVTMAITDEKKLRHQIESHLQQSIDWEKRAILALEKSDEALAQEALLKKQEHDTIAFQMKKDWEIQKGASEKLKTQLQLTVDKVEKSKREYNILLAQYQSAKAHQAVNQTLSNVSSSGSLHLVEELRNKVAQMQAQTEAQIEVSGHISHTNLEDKFAALEKDSSGKKLLEDLKSKMSLQPQISYHDEMKEAIPSKAKKASGE